MPAPQRLAREAAAAADVVITSLMDDKSVLAVVQAGDGVLAGMRPDAVHACVTTISPECADELESLHRGHGSCLRFRSGGWAARCGRERTTCFVPRRLGQGGSSINGCV